MDAALAELLKQGILGILLAIFIIGFVAVSRLLLAEKDKRITDAEKTRDSIAEPMRQVREAIERMEGKIVISKRAENNENT